MRQQLLEEALQAVQKITSPDWKALALSRIAQVVAREDEEKAAELMDDAFAFSRQIGDPQWQMSVFFTLLRTFAAIAPKEAFEMAMEPKTEPLAVMALADAVEHLIARNKEFARRFLQDAQRVAEKIEDLDAQEEAFSALAESWASVDFKAALRLIARIRQPATRATALCAVARELAKTDRETAQNLAFQAAKLVEKLRDPEDKTLVLDELVEVLCLLDETEQALAFAHQQPFPERKAVALSVVAQKLVPQNPEQARALLQEGAALAKQVRDPDRQASAWRNLAGVMATLDLDQAVAWAQQIADEDWRNWTLGDIAAVIAERDPEEALKIADQISDEEERSSALADVAIAVAKGDLQHALEIVRSLPDPFYRVQALCEIAQQLD